MSPGLIFSITKWEQESYLLKVTVRIKFKVHHLPSTRQLIVGLQLTFPTRKAGCTVAKRDRVRTFPRM